MDEALSYEVLERLIGTGASGRVTDLVLAACDGDAELDRAIGGASPARPTPASAEARSPLGAYVKSVRVQGFRGIGAPATIDLQPTPGLTVVTGRNGSGKSSFAEALEVLLTGTADRLHTDQPAVLRDGWRNLHAPDPCSVRAELVIEGRGGVSTIEHTWPAGASLADGETTVQLPGERKGPFEQLGWASHLVAYRPFLAHGELEAMFGKPSALYDRLSEVLGLDDLTDALKRLTSSRKNVDDSVSGATKEAKRLAAVLGGIDDDRARTCTKALKGPAWDVATVRDLATGGSGDDDDASAALARLAALVLPDTDRVLAAVDELRTAAEHLRAVAATDAERSRQLAQLLRLALTHQHDHGGGPCPVCGAGVLDDAWRIATEAAIERLDAEAADAERAHAAATRARSGATALVRDPPAALDLAGSVEIDATDLRAAWTAWAALPLWSALSDACHVHEYDLAPTAAELHGLLETTRQITTRLRAGS